MRRAEDLLNAVSETEVFRENRGHEWTNDLERRTNELRAVTELQNRNLNTICTFHHCYHKVSVCVCVEVN